MHHIPEATRVSLESLMDAVLPIFSPGELDSVCERLISNGSIQGSDENPRWECLPWDPSAFEDKTGTFKFLEKVVLAVTNSHSEAIISDTKFKIAQEATPIDSRHHSWRPDGCFYLGKRQRGSSKVNWTDLIMPMEFENGYNEYSKRENYDKVMLSMHHVMRNDARRRFVHGLTCENTTASLWYHDRCDIVVSQEFDINMDWKYLVRIILSVLLATPDRLGYDPDMVLLPLHDPDTEPCYDITIHNNDTEVATVYRTIKVISNFETDSMLGPGTRAWIAQKLVDGDLVGSCCVLKDTWVREDNVAEHVVLKKVRAEQPLYAQYFLTPLDHGFACFSVAAFDNTHKTLRRMKLKPTKPVLLTCFDTMSSPSRKVLSTSRHSGGTPDDIPNWRPAGHHDSQCLSEHPRQHYRIVFKEIGLHAMHLCGYVHRNTSSGNILLVPASGALGQRGVIADLEYAKKINERSAPHDVKTGTAVFMATEVAYMEHHRLMQYREHSDSEESADSVVGHNDESNMLPPFRHNPLHDMESIWWICIWTTFYLIPAGQSIGVQLDNYHKVFLNTASKHDFITYRQNFKSLTTHLSEIPSFASLMRKWSASLNGSYKESYMQHDASGTHLGRIRIDDETIKACYDHGRSILQQLEEASRSLSVTFVTLSEQSNSCVKQQKDTSSMATTSC